MKIYSVESLGEQKLEYIGIVHGSTVRSKNLGKDITAGFKNIVGGEAKSYSELMVEGRTQAIERMVQEAETLGADAIVGYRASSTSVAQGMAEVYVYGTAVKFL